MLVKEDQFFWKFNSMLVNNNEYYQLVDESFKTWLEEIFDKCALQDLLIYKFRLFTIDYRKADLIEVELRKLRCCKEKCDAEPSIQNVKELERIQAKYDIMMNFMIVTLGAIVCSRATKHEKGKKNNKYF